MLTIAGGILLAAAVLWLIWLMIEDFEGFKILVGLFLGALLVLSIPALIALSYVMNHHH